MQEVIGSIPIFSTFAPIRFWMAGKTLIDILDTQQVKNLNCRIYIPLAFQKQGKPFRISKKV